MIGKLKGEDILPHIGRKGVMKGREEGRKEKRKAPGVDSRRAATKEGRIGSESGRNFRKSAIARTEELLKDNFLINPITKVIMKRN